MRETFNNIISNKSFERVGSRRLIRRKIFRNEVIRSRDLIGMAFSHHLIIVWAY